MANITGTNGNDTLTGTSVDDKIQGLNGNDRIIGSFGNDTVDGGAGNDTVEYSGSEFADQNLSLLPDSFDGSLRFLVGSKEDKLLNIETIIANKPTFEFNGASLDFGFASDVDVDLSKNRLTYSIAISSQNSLIRKTINVQNFKNISTGGGNNRIKGNDLNNSIRINDRNNTIIGSKGDDFIFGTEATFDYSNFGVAVSLGIPLGSSSLSVSKGSFGVDTLACEVQKVIGATNKANTVAAGQFTPVDVNLAKNMVGNGSIQVEVINFVDVIGSSLSDKIVGSNKSGKLTGGGDNDIITGGNSSDIIIGSDATYKGVGEVDTLTGGGGRDKFVLGDASGAYYVGKGKDDYALITDFNLFQDSIDLGGFKDYSFASGANNSIELYSGKDVKTRDLIAKIQLAGGISSASSNSRSTMGADANLAAITAKIDILSGSSSSGT